MLDLKTASSTAQPHLADRWRQFAMSPLNASPFFEGAHVQVGPGSLRKKALIYGNGLYKNEALDLLSDNAWEVWALNLIPPVDSHGRLRADVWFDLHQRCAQTVDDMRWIEACPFPIYVPPDLMDGVPNARRFPLQEIELQCGAYWACTFAYQIALAMYLGMTDIGLFGVELAYGTERERTVEWACTAYWLGRAEERGIGIHLPANSTMGRHVARYGFEYYDELDQVAGYTEQLRKGDVYRRAQKAGVDIGG